MSEDEPKTKSKALMKLREIRAVIVIYLKIIYYNNSLKSLESIAAILPDIKQSE